MVVGRPSIVSAVAGDELEVLVTQAGLVELLNLIGQIAESRSVGDHGLLNSTEQDLSNQLTGSGSAEVGGLGNVLQNAELLGILGNVQGPVSAGELRCSCRSRQRGESSRGPRSRSRCRTA